MDSLKKNAFSIRLGHLSGNKTKRIGLPQVLHRKFKQFIPAVTVCPGGRSVGLQNPAVFPINEKNDVPAVFNQELEAAQGLFGDLAFGDIPDKNQGPIFTVENKRDGIDLHI